MKPWLRYLHYVAIGVQLSGIALFVWAWTATGQSAWMLMVGWCVVYGALSLAALKADRKASGVEV